MKGCCAPAHINQHGPVWLYIRMRLEFKLVTACACAPVHTCTAEQATCPKWADKTPIHLQAQKVFIQPSQLPYIALMLCACVMCRGWMKNVTLSCVHVQNEVMVNFVCSGSDASFAAKNTTVVSSVEQWEQQLNCHAHELYNTHTCTCTCTCT